MTDVSTAPRRPATVTALAVLVFIGAVLEFAAAVAAIVFVLRPGETQQFFGRPISDWYWVMTAILSAILGLIYLWISRGQLRGDPQAWMLVNILALINMVFAVFQIPFGTGWAILCISAILLILNNTPAARIWFTADLANGSGQRGGTAGMA